VERVLRPGVVLRVRTGAGNGGDDVAAGGGSGRSWRAWKRAAGEGNRAGIGEGQRVEGDPARGGAVAAVERRPEAKHCAGGGGAEQSMCSRKKKRGEGSGGLFENFRNLRDLSVN
jgi:hypothetical protein